MKTEEIYCAGRCGRALPPHPLEMNAEAEGERPRMYCKTCAIKELLRRIASVIRAHGAANNPTETL